MKITEVPPDDSITYMDGKKKILYVLDENGQYTTVPVAGWEVEAIGMNFIWEEFKKKAEDARKRIMQDETSPVEYYMHLRLMDVNSLADASGISSWRVKRHFKPHVFKKLNDKILQEYARVFMVTVDDLKQFKEKMSVGNP